MGKRKGEEKRRAAEGMMGGQSGARAAAQRKRGEVVFILPNKQNNQSARIEPFVRG